MKNLQNLKGAKALSKNEQQSINGGAGGCESYYVCQQRCDLYNGHCEVLIGTSCHYCFGGGPA